VDASLDTSLGSSRSSPPAASGLAYCHRRRRKKNGHLRPFARSVCRRPQIPVRRMPAINFSHDRSGLLFRGSKAKKVLRQGGVAVHAVRRSNVDRVGSWGEDGTIVSHRTLGALNKVSSSGGSAPTFPPSRSAAGRKSNASVASGLHGARCAVQVGCRGLVGKSSKRRWRNINGVTMVQGQRKTLLRAAASMSASCQRAPGHCERGTLLAVAVSIFGRLESDRASHADPRRRGRLPGVGRSRSSLRRDGSIAYSQVVASVKEVKCCQSNGWIVKGNYAPPRESRQHTAVKHSSRREEFGSGIQ